MFDPSMPAVDPVEGDDAIAVLKLYLDRNPQMLLANHPSAAVEKQPQGTGAGDKLMKPN
jgi:hypothetical protein